jgi:hypothetical protein
MAMNRRGCFVTGPSLTLAALLSLVSTPSAKEAGQHGSAIGPIAIDKEYSHSFLRPNGERFFPMGDTAYFLMGRPTDVIAHYIDVRRAHGFNFLRMMAMGDGFWPFGACPIAQITP